MRISFELTERDLGYFRDALKASLHAVRHAEEAEIVEAIRDVLDEIRGNTPLPDFVSERIPRLESLVQMLTDDEWCLPQTDRERLLATFCYFADPEDILPDNVPVIGYLDDVIVIELILHELAHVCDSYGDFCEFREAFDREHADTDPAVRRDRLDRRRQQLHQRMKSRAAAAQRTGLW